MRLEIGRARLASAPRGGARAAWRAWRRSSRNSARAPPRRSAQRAALPCSACAARLRPSPARDFGAIMARFLRARRASIAPPPSLPSATRGSAGALRCVPPRSTAISRLRAQKVMDVIVIGGGIAGIATAYQLHAAGHRVCVIERHATVAQGATYGQGGALLPSPLDVWFGPTFMASSRAKQSGMVVKTGFDSRRARFREAARAAARPRGVRGPIRAPAAARRAVAARARRYRSGWTRFRAARAACCTCSGTRASSTTRSRPSSCSSASACRTSVLTPEECVAVEPSVPDDPAFAGGVLLAR